VPRLQASSPAVCIAFALAPCEGAAPLVQGMALGQRPNAHVMRMTRSLEPGWECIGSGEPMTKQCGHVLAGETEWSTKKMHHRVRGAVASCHLHLGGVVLSAWLRGAAHTLRLGFFLAFGGCDSNKPWA